MVGVLLILVCLVVLAKSSDKNEGFHFCLSNIEICRLRLIPKLIDVLTNEHIVFVGDSLTRYQYISLVYMLRHQRSIDPKSNPNLVEEKTWKSWNDFFIQSTTLLSPNEICDCTRPEGKVYASLFFENRYYYDKTHNISVSFIQYVGWPHSESRGHLTYNDIQGLNFTQEHPRDYTSHPVWVHNLDTLFSDYVSNFEHTVSIVVLNFGRWGNSYTSEMISKAIYDVFTLNEKAIFIWKTTTYATEEVVDKSLRHAFDDTDSLFQSFDVVSIMNTSWTGKVNSSYYWDDKHFREPIYMLLNDQLMDIIEEKKREITDSTDART